MCSKSTPLLFKKLITGSLSAIPVTSKIDFSIWSKFDFEHISFSDHFNYSQNDIDKIEKDNNKLIVTTEKDFQKIQLLQRKNKWVYLEIKIEFLENESLFNSIVKKAIISWYVFLLYKMILLKDHFLHV